MKTFKTEEFDVFVSLLEYLVTTSITFESYFMNGTYIIEFKGY